METGHCPGIENYSRLIPGCGYGTRVEDYLLCLDTALERAPEADLILFAGDVYKNPVPNPTVQRRLQLECLVPWA